MNAYRTDQPKPVAQDVLLVLLPANSPYRAIQTARGLGDVRNTYLYMYRSNAQKERAKNMYYWPQYWPQGGPAQWGSRAGAGQGREGRD